MDRKVAPNVMQFIRRAAAEVGKLAEDRFGCDLHHDCADLEMGSPIEHLFWVACHALARSASAEVNPETADNQVGNHYWNGKFQWHGLFIKPQAQIGKYRVDFLVSQSGIAPEEIYTPVVVELDGHDFHDKNKYQRSYEKARDRFLTKQKYKVFHFTGSDVVKDPFRVAHEVLSELGIFNGMCPDEYNPKNPLETF